MATSRRTRAATGRPAPRSNNPNSALEPIDPAAPDEPELDAGEAPAEESSSGSSRRTAAGGRKSRRMQVPSSTKTPAYKSGRVLTPEEQIARRKAVKSFFVLMLCLVLFLGAIGAGWFFFLREDEGVKKAQAVVSEGENKYRMIETTLKNRQPREARAAFNDGLKVIAVPELGNAKEPIDEHDPLLVSKQLAYKAIEIGKKIRETEPRIDKLERDIKAEANHRQVMEGFRTIADLSEPALIEHEKLTGLFIANPVEPPAGGRDEYVADYAGMVQEVKSQMNRIDQEKDRRLAAITSDQEKLAHGEVKALVKQEQFKAALDKLGEYKDKFEQGNFAHLRSFVEDSAKQAWESAQKYADSRYTDYKAPGIPKTIGEQALRDARTRLQQVVDRFGMDEYISQAKALLDKYPTP
ncbi:MAG: hypothetical protein H0W78_15090 [Planctomycetes bacterium]|nr:hypothetical protein [Planctomycetota bacterium]